MTVVVKQLPTQKVSTEDVRYLALTSIFLHRYPFRNGEGRKEQGTLKTLMTVYYHQLLLILFRSDKVQLNPD